MTKILGICLFLFSVRSLSSVAGSAQADNDAGEGNPVASFQGRPQTTGPLTLIRTIEMPDVPTGPYTDHLAVDLKGHRLFATPQAHNSVQVFDISAGKFLHEITGMGNPHAVLYRSDLDRIYVVDGDAGLIRIYDGHDYHPLQNVKVLLNADSMAYDPDTKLMYVTNGGAGAHLDHSFISVIDTTTAQDLGDINFPSLDLGAMALENATSRMYINIIDRNEIGVVDRQKRTVLATWPVANCKKNEAIALDEDRHRLFVGCRNTDMSGVIVVLDTQTGKQTGTMLPIGGWVDYQAFDPLSRRLYASCGIGFVYVYQEREPDHYALIGRAETAVMAKTGLLVPELHRFFVSVPHLGGTPAKVLVFQVQ